MNDNDPSQPIPLENSPASLKATRLMIRRWSLMVSKLVADS